MNFIELKHSSMGQLEMKLVNAILPALFGTSDTPP
jgi:hypothetical protein